MKIIIDEYQFNQRMDIEGSSGDLCFPQVDCSLQSICMKTMFILKQKNYQKLDEKK